MPLTFDYTWSSITIMGATNIISIKQDQKDKEYEINRHTTIAGFRECTY